ncbi:hypothetical protein LINPERHAP2_LOCUS27668, partial [Linum perenne]
SDPVLVRSTAQGLQNCGPHYLGLVTGCTIHESPPLLPFHLLIWVTVLFVIYFSILF